MDTEPVLLETDGPIATITFNDAERRNAMGLPMFDRLDQHLHAVGVDDSVVVLLLRGRGRAFSAGFDLRAAADDPSLLERYILRLSGVLRVVRRLPAVTVAAVHGAAIAGGCALMSACDLVVTAPDAKIGYPVHRLGISPAVSYPTLEQTIGAGPARHMQMGGDLIDGRRAHELGLASHLAESAEQVPAEARRLCELLADHGHHALKTTKAWLNELDGSLDDERFEGPAVATARAALADEAVERLRAMWG